MQTRLTVSSIEHGIKQTFSWLNWLVLTTLAFALLATASRHFGIGTVPVLGVHIPYQYSHVVFILFTGVHIFILKHIVDATWEAWENMEKTERIETYDNLVRSGGVIIKGGAYYRDKMFEQDGRLYLKTDVQSPETWVHLLLVILSFSAMVDLAWTTVNYIQFSIAVIILHINWTIGANILMALGDLGRKDSSSIYFQGDKKGVRSFSTVSGFWINDTESYKSFVYSAIIHPLINLVFLAILLFAITGISIFVAALARWLFF